MRLMLAALVVAFAAAICGAAGAAPGDSDYTQSLGVSVSIPANAVVGTCTQVIVTAQRLRVIAHDPPAEIFLPPGSRICGPRTTHFKIYEGTLYFVAWNVMAYSAPLRLKLGIVVPAGGLTCWQPYAGIDNQLASPSPTACTPQ